MTTGRQLLDTADDNATTGGDRLAEEALPAHLFTLTETIIHQILNRVQRLLFIFTFRL